MSSLRLGVNIDHVATLRQARYALMPDAHNVEPDLAAAAAVCEKGGASGITVHLREDRRHIQDRDVERLKESVTTKLNLEMGNTAEILGIALRIHPKDVCLVPENRQEITTEGGLDVTGKAAELEPTVGSLRSAGIRVSLFIDPEPEQVAAASKLGATAVELHTGTFANAKGEEQKNELARLVEMARLAAGSGLVVNAGHGINYTNIGLIREIPGLTELNIGHSIVSHAVTVGLEAAVRTMVELMNPRA